MRALALVLLASTSAHAESRSCANLEARPWAQFSSFAQKRLPNGQDLAQRKDFPKLTVEVILQRTAHIAREVLGECLDVTVDAADNVDERHLTSVVTLHVKSFGALSRIAQLPAVESISVIVPQRRIRHPLPSPRLDLQ
jgi:hypothetical protein